MKFYVSGYLLLLINYELLNSGSVLERQTLKTAFFSILKYIRFVVWVGDSTKAVGTLCK